ncbi:unnamed protein product, partial [marine sediment metagenome]
GCGGGGGGGAGGVSSSSVTLIVAFCKTVAIGYPLSSSNLFIEMLRKESPNFWLSIVRVKRRTSVAPASTCLFISAAFNHTDDAGKEELLCNVVHDGNLTDAIFATDESLRKIEILYPDKPY